MSGPLPVIDDPRQDHYDVVIIGGAIIGSSVAWWLSRNPDFDGSVLVLDRDMTYENASTSHTNSCMRQQFSNEVNVRISQFGAEFVRNFRDYMGGKDPDVPELATHHFGYMYLAADDAFAQTLRSNQAIQAGLGAGTRILSPAEIAEAYPFYFVEDLVCGSHNLVDEGYFDGGTMFAWWRRGARTNGVEYIQAEVADLEVSADAVTGVRLASGRSIGCGTIVNASGPRAAKTAAMAGVEIPIEPRKRFTFIFDCADRLDRALPLTIDPSGVHVRTDGDAFMAGCTPTPDPAVAFDDFAMDQDIFEDYVWPALAHRIPAFERIKVTNRWAGHYAHNLLDHNVVVGRHPEISNFVFTSGFSGHGLQQSPAIGRGAAELIAYGEYRTLDLSPLGYERVAADAPFLETAII
ncbi:MAG: FAD-binding oxidoreductase [Actinomycetota bacterium]